MSEEHQIMTQELFAIMGQLEVEKRLLQRKIQQQAEKIASMEKRFEECKCKKEN